MDKQSLKHLWIIWDNISNTQLQTKGENSEGRQARDKEYKGVKLRVFNEATEIVYHSSHHNIEQKKKAKDRIWKNSPGKQ